MGLANALVEALFFDATERRYGCPACPATFETRRTTCPDCGGVVVRYAGG